MNDYLERNLIPQINDSSVKSLKAGLLLLGSFAFAYNSSAILHELGHAVFLWCSGGSARIVINPFSWSYTYGSFAEHPLLSNWSGVGLGSLFALILLALTWRWRGPYVFFILLTGVLVFICNGIYFIIDSLMCSGGDATDLISHGTPILITVSFGFILIVIGAVLLISLLPVMGFSVTDSAKKRMLIFSIGILPYLLAMFVYHCLYNIEEIILWSIFISFGIVIIIAISFISTLIHQRIEILKRMPAKIVSWPAVILNISLALILMAILFILSNSRYPSDFEQSDVRPEDFPEILVTSEYAENVKYTSFSKSDFYLSYDVNFNCMDSRHELYESINDRLILNSYHKLKYSLFDPNILNEPDWKSEEAKFEETTFENYWITSQWLKIYNEKIEHIIVRLDYSEDLETKKLFEMRVTQALFLKKLDSSDYLSKYKQAHPNELDWNSIDNSVLLEASYE